MAAAAAPSDSAEGGGGDADDDDDDDDDDEEEDTGAKASSLAPDSTGGAAGADDATEADAVAGLGQLLALRGTDGTSNPTGSAANINSAGRVLRLGDLRSHAQLSHEDSARVGLSGTAHGALTILQLTMVGWVALLLFKNNGSAPRLLRRLTSGWGGGNRLHSLPPPRGSGRPEPPPQRRHPAARSRCGDSRLQGEL